MTAALEGVSGQQHAPAAIYPRKRPGTHFTGSWVGRSGRAENLVPTGIRSRSVQPAVSRYTDWATRPTPSTCFEEIIIHRHEVISVNAATVFCYASSLIVLAARHLIDAWYNTICCVYSNNLLMMDIYLFETCRRYLINTRTNTHIFI